MPATLDAYETPGMKADLFYPVIDVAAHTGTPFPNKELFAIRKQMRGSILQSLQAE